MYNTEGMTKEKLDYMEDPGILIVQNGTSEDTRRDLPNTSYISNTVCKNFLMEAQSRVFQLKKSHNSFKRTLNYSLKHVQQYNVAIDCPVDTRPTPVV